MRSACCHDTSVLSSALASPAGGPRHLRCSCASTGATSSTAPARLLPPPLVGGAHGGTRQDGRRSAVMTFHSISERKWAAMSRSSIWVQHCSPLPTHPVQFGDDHRRSPVFSLPLQAARRLRLARDLASAPWATHGAAATKVRASGKMGRLAPTPCILPASQCCIWWELHVSSNTKSCTMATSAVQAVLPMRAGNCTCPCS